MGITIQANDINDARHKLSLVMPRSDIRIEFRGGGDYGRIHKAGCIVDATSCGEEVKRVFNSSKEAARYIERLLQKRDAWVAAELAKKEKKIA